MKEYYVTIKEGSDKSSVMSIFSSITDPLVASQRVFSANIEEEDLVNYRSKQDIDAIEEANVEIKDD
jgi:hypothetical protein|tara:strand:+ start:72 stop:272 length:201 start_codon:yes stop_codon:yes gene_type:complete